MSSERVLFDIASRLSRLEYEMECVKNNMVSRQLIRSLEDLTSSIGDSVKHIYHSIEKINERIYMLQQSVYGPRQ